MQGVIIAPIWLGGNYCERGLLSFHGKITIIAHSGRIDSGRAKHELLTDIRQHLTLPKYFEFLGLGTF